MQTKTFILYVINTINRVTALVNSEINALLIVY